MSRTDKNINIPIWKLLSKRIKFLDQKQKIYRKENNKAVKEAKRLMSDRLERINHLQARMDAREKESLSRLEFELYKKEIALEIKAIQRYVNIGIGIWLLGTIVAGSILYLILK